MLKVVALVREEKGAPVQHVKAKAESKNKFRQELKANGFRIVALMTKDEALMIKGMPYAEFLSHKYKNLSSKEQTLIYDYVTQVL